MTTICPCTNDTASSKPTHVEVRFHLVPNLDFFINKLDRQKKYLKKYGYTIPPGYGSLQHAITCRDNYSKFVAAHPHPDYSWIREELSDSGF